MSAFHRKNSSAREGSGLSTRDEEMALREADARFVAALQAASDRGEFPKATATDAPMADAA